MNPAWYLVSWFLNLLIIAVLVALADRTLRLKIEEHQTLGAFFIFFLPVFLELVSFVTVNRPFLFNFVS